ncbi:THAP domain-containing protein 5-like isoform X2 [Leucoraja erinacea]|uniref:THAP domain-containing protein 5-like isoform X2 n=1 Tax=Leucoraja erinaceus TaxID=7782 RepID=UPI0024581D93|nr:THAP domain-containing protein 5-like isoform X2 [Leucoraja erinacea]
MPKNCAVRECTRHAGQLAADNRRISFYKFPSNDKERLAQWLSNMKREKWVPSQYQYICSEHFTPESFEWRWGTRYLKAGAKPTIFSFPEQPTKRKAVARSNGNKRQKKRLEAQTNEEELLQQEQTVPVQSPDSKALTVLTMSSESTCLTEVTASASIIEFDKVVMSSVDPCDKCISETITPSTTALSNEVVNYFKPLQMNKDGPSHTLLEEQSVLPFENVAAIETVQLASTLASIETEGITAIMPSVKTLQFTPMQTCDDSESELTLIEIVLPEQDQQNVETLSAIQQDLPTPELSTIVTSAFKNVTALAVDSTSQVLSPTNLSSQTSQLLTAAAEPLKAVSTFQTEVTLPSTLIMPIISTPPVDQNHTATPPAPVIAEAETVLTTQNDTQEVQDEHSYHKNDLTIEQLEEIVATLQKKVKVIQQRERRNSARLKAMENLVDQLKKENVISEEKLKIMEMTCSQTNAQVINPSNTVMVICEDNGNLIYTLQESPIEDDDDVL